MPNGNHKNNNGRKEIELLPEELRRPEIRKKEEKPEIKMFVPPEEERRGRSYFWKKILGTREEREKKKKEKRAQKESAMKKEQEERARLEVFKMKAATKREEAPPKPQFQKPPSPPPPIPPSPPEVKPPPKIFSEVGPPGPEEAIPPKKRFGITLMPDKLAAPKEAKLGRQIAILVAIILILGAILGGLFEILKWRRGEVGGELRKIESSLGDLNQKIQDLEEEKNQAQILQKQLKAANALLTQHIYWTNVFDFLEKNTIADVYFQTLVGASDGQITLTAIAKNYGAVAEQIVAFREDEQAEKISITSASASILPTGEVGEVNFDANLKLKPEIFLK